MERRPYDLTRILRENIPCDDCDRATDNSDNGIPSCINTDFCVETPDSSCDGILAMAFVNMQPMDTVYPTETAFSSGTLFPSLDKPFYGGMRR